MIVGGHESFGLWKKDKSLLLINPRLIKAIHGTDRKILTIIDIETLDLIQDFLPLKSIIFIRNKNSYPYVFLTHGSLEGSFAGHRKWTKQRERFRFYYDTSFCGDVRSDPIERLFIFWNHLKGVQIDVRGSLRFRDKERSIDVAE